MAPSMTLPETPLAIDGVTKTGFRDTIKETDSWTSDSSTSLLQELDASKLTFTRNPNPKSVPEPGSAEEASTAV